MISNTINILAIIEALIEIGIIVVTLDLTALPAIILIEIVTLNNFYIAIQINIPNFKSLFRMEFATRIVIEDSALDLREKKLKRLYFIEMLLRFNRLFQEQEEYSITLILLDRLVIFK